ncbi:hypothetical protein [Winogradskyella sp. 3972H.M.0a.05]|uniref:hypothetical protein n=1 Tax=Winogradskyella sp. 3972H.M.0a.05 TaxID=2950277 RepID=UPI0033978B7F
MKSISKILGTLSLVTFVFSCSSVKVTDSWKDTETIDIKDKVVMVVSRTQDDVVRKQFESDIVHNLEKNNITSIESHKLFPLINEKKELSDKELKSLKKELKEQDIEIVVMTSVKDVQSFERTVTQTTDYNVYTYPVVYRRGYRRGFVGYYNSIYVNSDPVSTVTSTGKKYILETVTYDLTLPEEEQLTSVITSVIDNPESVGTTSKDFSKKLVKELVK